MIQVSVVPGIFLVYLTSNFFLSVPMMEIPCMGEYEFCSYDLVVFFVQAPKFSVTHTSTRGYYVKVENTCREGRHQCNTGTSEGKHSKFDFNQILITLWLHVRSQSARPGSTEIDER